MEGFNNIGQQETTGGDNELLLCLGDHYFYQLKQSNVPPSPSVLAAAVFSSFLHQWERVARLAAVCRGLAPADPAESHLY